MEDYIESMQRIRNFVIEKIEECDKELDTTTSNERKRTLTEKKGFLWTIKMYIEKEVIIKILK